MIVLKELVEKSLHLISLSLNVLIKSRTGKKIFVIKHKLFENAYIYLN